MIFIKQKEDGDWRCVFIPHEYAIINGNILLITMVFTGLKRSVGSEEND